MPRHDPHLTTLTDNSRTIPPNHPRFTLTLERIHHTDLVSLRDPLGDGDDELDLILYRFDDCVCCEGRGDVYHRGVGVGGGDCVSDGAEDGETEVFGAGFL